MNKKRIGGVLVVLLLVFALVGCQGEKGQGSTDNSKSNESDGTVKLTLWNTWVEEAAESSAAIKRVEAFNESQDEIEITLETTPHDQYKTKLKTQAAGKQLPELLQVWPGAELEPLAEGGVLKAIDSIKSDWEGMIADSVMKDYAYDGTQYAIPGTMSFTSLIYYDKDMVAGAGFEAFPQTYEEFKQLISKLNENGVTPIHLGNKGQWVLQSVYISTIADRLTGSDFLTNVLNGEAKFTDEKFVESLAIIQELNDMGSFNEDLNTLDDIQSREQFFQGNAAMHIGGSWSVGPLIEGIPEGKNIGIAKFPAIEGGNGDPNKVSGVSSVGIALNSNLTEEQEAAAHEFLKFFYSEELYTQWIKDGLMVAGNVDIPEDVNPIVKDVIDTTNGGIAPVYDGVLSPELTSIINNGLQAITTGSSTPEDVAENMQSELEK